MIISADLPECQFGGERYVTLSADGSFIALVTRSAVQVWQVGGGLLYEAAYNRRFSTDAGTCGIDIPRLAISPDGRLLAISGMDYTRDSLNRFFRVVDVLANEVVYEWDGSRDNLHGLLDNAPGLGFSRDGRFLQTFDPLRFTLSGDASTPAFRFWSTTNWQEIDPASLRIGESYTSGELLFTRHTSDGLEVRHKTTGAVVKRLPQAPCSILNPCQMRFSPDGGQAVLLSTLAGTQPFRGALLADRLIRVDMIAGELLEGPTGLFRDLEGTLVDDEGGITIAAAKDDAGVPDGAWWTSGDTLDGLRPLPDGALLFTPRVFFLAAQSSDELAQPCPYCAVCRLGEPWSGLECQPGLVSDQGEGFTFATMPESYGLTLLDDSGVKAGSLPLPADLAGYLPKPYPGGDFGRGLSLRPLGYSQEFQTAFYCLDLDQRPAGCLIADVESGNLISEMKEAAFLRFSPDGKRATLFDRQAFQQVIVDLESTRLTSRSAFQARAYPAPAYFFKDGATLAFLIQELQDRSAFWLELTAADGDRALGRVRLRDAALIDPVALGADPDERFWVIGERDGRALLLDFDSGAPLHAWQAHTGELIGLQFAGGGRLLVSMGADGLLRLWGVPR